MWGVGKEVEDACPAAWTEYVIHSVEPSVVGPSPTPRCEKN